MAQASAAGPPRAGQSIIASHPRYQYFARAYGLDIASLEWEAGAASTQAQWTDLKAMSEDTGATLLMWEAAPLPEAMAHAEELG